MTDNVFNVESDLGEQLRFLSLDASENLGSLFTFRLQLVGNAPGISLPKLLGTPMNVKIVQSGGITRHFHGIVVDAAQTGYADLSRKEFAQFEFTLRPRVWLLTRKIDSRIYKNMSVPEIVESALNEIGYSDVAIRLSATYPKREYCVQYREDGFNFISRLMEQEGIYYYFEHDSSKHTMVLVDSLGGHKPISGGADVSYRPDGGAGRHWQGAIREFQASCNIQSTRYELVDYDPLKPRQALLSVEKLGSSSTEHNVSGLENFDYPGDFEIPADGDRYAKVRLEALNVGQSRFVGTADAWGVAVGGLFKLKDAPDPPLAQEYLVVASSIHVNGTTPHSGTGGNAGAPFTCSFEAIESRRPFRSPLTASKPMVANLQTAIVCGSKEAEDIVVDKYGRVQVIFHWLKSDRKFHDVSCPVRVASSWAGKQWGMVSIPRVGQEVVISFLEGDPDRPLIIGSVYNADNMPPYELPANMTQSGIKSRSHKGGGAANFNEFRFEDKKGSEEVYIHAEKDLREMVENDHFVEVGRDETEVIKNNRTHSVGKEDKLDVGANSTTDVKQKYKLTAGTEIELITGASSIKMTAGGDITIKGVNITIEGSMNVEVKAGVGLKASGGATMEVSGGVSGTVKAAMLNLTGSGIASLGGGLIKIG
ncbi:type VI secretion system Vgr family protein [Nevskia sp.]|uniref:type VI secretion system Vgr family protein n=1 Tax=Nevskia sp. TaxID=1929292 RepID=UPI0025D2208A|nr:type VI secretion system tip protein TssI/VgrG [Nevskia sp.]